MTTQLISDNDPALRLMAEKFVFDESGVQVSLDPKLIKAWVVVAQQGDMRTVEGVISLQQVLDIPNFLVKKGLPVVDFCKRRDALIDRAKGFIEDNGGLGREVLVHISTDCKLSEDSNYIKRMGLTPAQRYSMEVL